MSGKNNTLPLDGCANLVDKLVDDFVISAENNYRMPTKKIYKVVSSPEPDGIIRSARTAALKRIGHLKPIRKIAFDTRRMDQENERNPRINLQYWNRSQQFIDDEDQARLDTFAKLLRPLDKIKEKHGHHPEYFQSYARTLRDSIKRAIKVKEDDLDIFRPQLDYLEQLLFARYRLSLEGINKMAESAIYDKIIKRDENLIRRNAYLKATEDNEDNEDSYKKANQPIVKDSNGALNENLVNAIFGNNAFRREGENKVTRTITVTITDEVID